MPVQDFECQIARGQIGRYLNGEGLSAEGLRQLGAHVAECSGCKSFLDQRKAALQGMLGEAVVAPREPVKPVIDESPSEALIAQIRARSGEGEPEPEPAAATKPVKPILTKPIILSGLLALVLLGMTYMSHNMSGLLGPTASQAVAPSKPDAGPARRDAAPAAKPEASTPQKPAASHQAKAPASTSSAPSRHDAKPAAAGQTSAPPVQPATAAPAVTINPATPTKSPFTAAVPSGQQGAAKPAAPAQGKPAFKAKARPRWRRPGVRRHWSLRHLKPGTAAIHVYRS